ncbi:MAG: hypothetical protein ACXVHW_12160 [Methanobacterium sp.]
MPDKKSKKEEYAEELEKLANEICEEKMKDKECLNSFGEGYKAGFADGYKAAMEDMKNMASQMTPEMRKQMEEGGQPVGWWPWW